MLRDTREVTPEPSTEAAPSPWFSRPAVAAYIGLGVLVVVVGVWSARADPSVPPIGDSTSSSPSASSNNEGGTPLFTIELTPGWVSATDPSALLPARLQVSPTSGAPWVLVGPGQGRSLFTRINPDTGTWSWSVRSSGRNAIDWAGTTAVFSTAPAGAEGPDSAVADQVDGKVVGKADGVFGVAPTGNLVFDELPGRTVVADDSTVVLQNGRVLASVSSVGRVAWRSRLPAGVTRAGGREPSSSTAVFVSSGRRARATVVDLSTGSAQTHRLPPSRPVSAWATDEGVLVGSGAPGELVLYDPGWDPVWARSGAVTIEDVRGGLVLVSDPVAQTLLLLSLSDGAPIWTSDPQDSAARSARLSPADDSVVLVSVEHAQPADVGPSLIAVSTTSGEDLWEVGDRRLLGLWRDYVLIGEAGGPVITALGLTDGTSFATLNASVSVSPSTSAVVGDRLIYLDHSAATARAIDLSSGP